MESFVKLRSQKLYKICGGTTISSLSLQNKLTHASYALNSASCANITILMAKFSKIYKICCFALQSYSPHCILSQTNETKVTPWLSLPKVLKMSCVCCLERCNDAKHLENRHRASQLATLTKKLLFCQFCFSRVFAVLRGSSRCASPALFSSVFLFAGFRGSSRKCLIYSKELKTAVGKHS